MRPATTSVITASERAGERDNTSMPPHASTIRDLNYTTVCYIADMPSILLVDDDPNFTELLSRFLQEQGYTVDTAANGWEALLVLDEKRIDLILLDVMMPGMDGITFLKIAQSAQRSLSAAVIVVTALSSQDAIARTRGLAVAEVVPKSIAVFDQVIKLVKRHLPLSQ
jgi:CheY-like chemotaxis protein